MGYRTDVVEFISPEHTDKNLMIRAIKSTTPGDPQSIAEYQALVGYWQVQPYLARLLAHELAALGNWPQMDSQVGPGSESVNLVAHHALGLLIIVALWVGT